MGTEISYVGKKVFIGIDVHRKTYTVSCVSEGEVVKKCAMAASPEALLSFIIKYFGGAEITTGYEAGFCGYVLHRYLESNGVTNKVIHAASIEISARDKVKTDKRDSVKIAMQLAAGRLRGIYVPSEALEARRLITRTREQLVWHRGRVMNQLRMKLHQFGLIDIKEKGVLSSLKVMRALRDAPSAELLEACQCLLNLCKGLNKEIRELNNKLVEQAKEDRLEAVYRCVPGVGPLTARILSNELGDMSQFPNEDSLFSFTGLTPREFSTGEHRRLGHISRQGSSRLRSTLVETAWRSIRLDPSLCADFQRIAARAGKKRSIVAIARKLIGRIRALFRKKEYYVYAIDWQKAA
jgi:transposase